MNRSIQAIIYVSICFFLSCMRASATTFMECSSKDIKTCTKEVTKGEMLRGLFVKNGKKYIKIDYQKLNEDKGTAVNDKD